MSAAIIVASGNGASALPAGIRILARGGSALDAVEECARIVEADPADTSVGRGGKPNVLGVVELDASIVDGSTHRVGAVAALVGYLHPISVARAVMERTPHVFLVGDGAARFAREIGAERTRNLTAATRALWVKRLRDTGETPAGVRRRAKLLPVVRKTVREERGTVNFLALDRKRNLASAVTTSGWAYKYPGRVGDSPVIGAGNYCDSRHGAVACTGYGELAVRNVTAKTAVDRLASGMPPDIVAQAAIADANALEDAAFNVVVLSARGEHAAATNRPDRRYCWMTTAMAEPAVAARTLVSRADGGSPSSRASARARSPRSRRPSDSRRAPR